MKCTRCGRENTSSASRCQYCNTPFNVQKMGGRKNTGMHQGILITIIALIAVLAILAAVYATGGFKVRKKVFSGGGGGAPIHTPVNPPTVMHPPGDSVQEESIFGVMPNKFVFTSGAGGWMTQLIVGCTGEFAGYFRDTDLGDIGPEHPNGSERHCIFHGGFAQAEKINQYSYSTRIEYLELAEEPGLEYIKDGVLQTTWDPYGLDDPGEFIIYLPETPINTLPEEFLDWVFISKEDRNTSKPLGFYGIYNVNGKMGFKEAALDYD